MAASYTLTEGSTGKQWSAVRAFTAHGPYVFMQLAQAVDGLDPAVGLVAKTIDKQAPTIDQFRATDPSEFADISLDPTGLLARTLPVRRGWLDPSRQRMVTNPAPCDYPPTPPPNLVSRC